jgi:hypothetical protein
MSESTISPDDIDALEFNTCTCDDPLPDPMAYKLPDNEYVGMVACSRCNGIIDWEIKYVNPIEQELRGLVRSLQDDIDSLETEKHELLETRGELREERRELIRQVNQLEKELQAAKNSHRTYVPGISAVRQQQNHDSSESTNREQQALTIDSFNPEPATAAVGIAGVLFGIFAGQAGVVSGIQSEIQTIISVAEQSYLIDNVLIPLLLAVAATISLVVVLVKTEDFSESEPTDPSGFEKE